MLAVMSGLHAHTFISKSNITSRFMHVSREETRKPREKFRYIIKNLNVERKQFMYTGAAQ